MRGAVITDLCVIHAVYNIDYRISRSFDRLGNTCWRRFYAELDRSRAAPGEPVVVFGTGFDVEGIRARFGDRETTVERLSPSELRVVVPEGVGKGPVTILRPDGRAALSPGDFVPERVVAEAAE